MHEWIRNTEVFTLFARQQNTLVLCGEQNEFRVLESFRNTEIILN
jgi:hypothetical protein